MTVNAAHLYVQDVLNKLSTNSGTNLSKHSFVRHYNASQIQWVEDRIKLSESNNVRIDEIQQLMKPEELGVKKGNGYWDSNFPSDYFHYVRSYSVADGCNVYHWKMREGDLNVVLRDSNYIASKEWEEAPVSIMDNKLRVYADFPIQNNYLVYYRFPIEINMKDGHLDVDGNATVDIDPEFTGSSLIEILTMTAANIAGITADQLQYQINQNRSSQHN